MTMILLELLLILLIVVVVCCGVAALALAMFIFVLSPAEKAVDKKLGQKYPTPDRYKKQREVFDSYQRILKTGHNLRGHYAFEVKKRENCTQREAYFYMIFEDCQDLGVEMNLAYAAALTGVTQETQNLEFLNDFPKLR